VRGSIDRPALAKTLNLQPNQKILLAQSVGYPKKSGERARSMDTKSHGTPILQVRRNLTNPDEFEAVVISADTFIVRPTTMSREELTSFLSAQVFEYPSHEEFLGELERKGSTTAQVMVTRNVRSD